MPTHEEPRQTPALHPDHPSNTALGAFMTSFEPSPPSYPTTELVVGEVSTLPAVIPDQPARNGRPSNVWRERMRKALTRAKADRVVEHIISGDIRELIGHDKLGQPIYAEVKNADRLAAIKLAVQAAYPELSKGAEASATLTPNSLTFTLKLGERDTDE